MQKIIIVDDFYDVAEQHHRSLFENKLTIGEETVGKISQILDKKIEIIAGSNEVFLENQSTPVCVHLNSDWIGVIYLSYPTVSFGEFGMKFYSHIETKLEDFPKGYDQNCFDPNKSTWKEYGKIPAKYNRLVLFRSNLWHSYGEGFGDKLDNGLLFQKLFIEEK